ncbi:hypothetical protein [Haloferula sargassicola]|uniref:Uncharacterized protein n=1 Tax=Haloferula sargassicola TaxID=490096 RepID=A0ABP9UNR4_9BACT
MKLTQCLANRGAAAVLLALGLATGSNASPVADDPFQTGGPPDYTAGIGNLVDQNPARPGFSGAWLAGYGGAQSPDVNATGLSYSDGTHAMAVGGGSVSYAGGGNGRSGRLLATPYGDATEGTVYLAVLMQLDSTAASDNYRGFELHQGGFEDGENRQFQIVTGEPGAGASDANFVVRLFNNAAFMADLGAPDTDVNLFVVKIVFSATTDADQVMVWRNPSDISSESLSGTPDASFSGFDLKFDRTSFARFNAANGLTYDELRLGTTWSDVTTVADTNDTDNDGLPDDWEISHSLDPNDDGTLDPDMGADGNPDLDGSPNLQEYQRGTDPQDPDTDDDNIFDGNETGTGIYVSAANTGTDPLLADTDGDSLRDDHETATRIYVDATDTGTDPNQPDSDGDGVNDGSEIAAGTDPNAAGSKPAPGDTGVVGIEVFDYVPGDFHEKTGGEGFDYDNSTLNDAFVGHLGTPSAWFDSFGDPRIVCGTLWTQNSGSYRAFNGPGSGGEAISRFGQVEGAAARTFYFKVDVTFSSGATYGGLSFYHGGTENLFFGLLGDGSGKLGVEETGGGGSIAGDPVTPGQTYTLVGVVASDEFSSFAKFFVDPDLGSAEPFYGDLEFPLLAEDKLYPSAIRLASGGTSPVVWDNLVLATTWEGLRAQPTDSDGDHLRDTYERAYAGDLTTLTSLTANDDGDTLTNGLEQQHGTHPLAEDTDGDTLADGVELDQSTNPCLLDTDSDGLNDNWETNTGTFVSPTDTGTSPVDADSDDDGYEDGEEIALGSDPNDGASSPETLDHVICNGLREEAYGSALAVQTVQTQFGDNYSELDAAYATVQDGKLFLLLTGNLEGNFNKLEIFIDSSSAVTSNVLNAAGNDFSNVMDGMIFDAGFTPDYHVIARRGHGSTDQFDLDFAALGSGQSVGFTNVFGGSQEGSAVVTGGTGTLAVQPIGVAYRNDNTAGVAGGTGAADATAAQAVVTGFEMSIDLADLGQPGGGDIKILAFVTSSDHTFASNQFLGGLPVDRDGAGSGTSNLGTTSAIDLGAIEGDQWFAVTVPGGSTELAIREVSLTGSTLTMALVGLSPASVYHVQYSPDLASPFTAVPSSTFTATSATDAVSVTTAGNQGFYRVAEGSEP